ncbi:MAG: PAS domain S-box protein, partial [Pseudomonadota bacterium]
MKKTPPPIDAEPLQISPVAKRGEPTHLREPAHDMAKVIIDSPMIILLLDTQGNIQYINPYLEQLFDCELHQVRGKDWFANFVPQHAREKMRNRFQGAVKSSVVRTYSCSVLTPNHGECAVEWREQPIYDEQSCVIALLAVGLDYLRNAESGHSAKGTILAGMDEANRVQQIMQMMRFSIDHMEDKMTWTDGSGKIIYANAAACRSLGYTLEELLNLSVSDIDPDYSAEMWPQHWEDLKKRGSLTFESRHQNKKGEIHPVEVTVNYMQFEDAEYNCAYIRDITRRKEMEEALQLSSLVFQHSIEGMLVTDENNQIIAVNPAFSKITGYSFEEVKGKNPRIFQSGHHDQNFYRAMWHELLSTGQWQGEIWDHDKAGLVQIKWLTINTIYKDGGAHRYVALFFDITDKKQAEELILRQANFDTLTGLPNRNMLRQQVEQAMKEAQRTGRPMALLLVDLDQFKEVNDTLGHDVGDLLLQEVASRIRGSVRESDVVARLGGDEFTVVLSQVDDLSSAEAIAQKIVDSLSMPYLLGGESVFVTASIGITLYPDDG